MVITILSDWYSTLVYQYEDIRSIRFWISIELILTKFIAKWLCKVVIKELSQNKNVYFSDLDDYCNNVSNLFKDVELKARFNN